MADNKAVHSRHVHEGPNASGASCCGGGYVARDQGGHGVHQGHDHHGPHDDQRHDHGGSAAPKDAEHRVKDPVCGMWVDPHTTKHRAEHNGQPYYFCSAGCREKFLADPLRYLDPAVAAAKAEPVPEGTIYTCPMHPEIRQVGPGSCPICGMALEPVLVSRDAEPNHELVDMTRRFWIGLALSLPVFALEMGGHLIGLDHLISPQTSNWIQLLLATPVVLWAGWPFFVRGWQSLVTRNLNMFTLIAMGTGVAWVYSVVATLAPGVFPAAFRIRTARSRSISRRRPSSPCSFCSGRSWSCAPARARAAPSAPSSTSRPRLHAASTRTEPRRRCSSTASMSATACASARARRCQWMALSSKGAAPSTNPWSRASRCR